jgi:hypothetical protein
VANAPLTNAEPDRAAPPVPVKAAYALLRPRIETNIVRVGSNRVVGVPVPAPGQTLIVDRVSAQETVRTASTLVPGGALVGDHLAAGRGGQSVAGRVFLRGTPPPEKSVPLDAVCGRLHPAPMTSRHFVFGQDSGLAGVFVYVKEGIKAQRVADPSVSPLLDQVNCEFQTYVIGVEVGQKLSVRNSDPVMHNVHILPKGAGNREKNVAQPVKGMVSSFIFEKPEVFIQIKCDVHPWMFAYVGVVEHPWFAATDKNGNFTLPPGLPAGEYTLAAVHRKAGEVIQRINVSTDGISPVTFTLDVPGELAGTETR